MAHAQGTPDGSDNNLGDSFNNIVDLICTELEKENDTDVTITVQTDITTDINVDSVAIMDLMFALEEEYNVSVPINDLADIRTVKELADLIQKLQG